MAVTMIERLLQPFLLGFWWVEQIGKHVYSPVRFDRPAGESHQVLPVAG
jgi:hypothetical protein